MNQIDLSIVIPCYNHGKFLLKAVESVVKIPDQIRYELLIVNDGSTQEETCNIFDDLSQEGFKILNKRNGGLGSARNFGIKVATGKYIMPLDSDNMLVPENLAYALTILERFKDISIVYSNAYFFGLKKGKWHQPRINPKIISFKNQIDACAIFRKEVWEKTGGYDEEMPIMGHEDWEFWINALSKGFKFKKIKRPLFYYRVRDESMISQVTQKKNFIKSKKYVYNKHFEFIYANQKHVFKEWSEMKYKYGLGYPWKLIKALKNFFNPPPQN